jgi:hypothetical protein
MIKKFGGFAAKFLIYFFAVLGVLHLGVAYLELQNPCPFRMGVALPNYGANAFESHRYVTECVGYTYSYMVKLWPLPKLVFAVLAIFLIASAVHLVYRLKEKN